VFLPRNIYGECVFVIKDKWPWLCSSFSPKHDRKWWGCAVDTANGFSDQNNTFWGNWMIKRSKNWNYGLAEWIWSTGFFGRTRARIPWSYQKIVSPLGYYFDVSRFMLHPNVRNPYRRQVHWTGTGTYPICGAVLLLRKMNAFRTYPYHSHSLWPNQWYGTIPNHLPGNNPFW